MSYKDPEKAAQNKHESYVRNRQNVIEAAAHWKKRYPTAAKLQARRTKLMQRYGITLEQYDELLARQNGTCGVCKRPAEGFRNQLAVDHDHHTGGIRGLLCTDCNRRIIGRHRTGLGGVELFANASEYLKVAPVWFVPPKKKKRKKRVLRSRK